MVWASRKSGAGGGGRQHHDDPQPEYKIDEDLLRALRSHDVRPVRPPSGPKGNDPNLGISRRSETASTRWWLLWSGVWERFIKATGAGTPSQP